MIQTMLGGAATEAAAENNEAADRHRTAANAATEEWNAFVHGSLNVPEDFPWPLPDKESN